MRIRFTRKSAEELRREQMMEQARREQEQIQKRIYKMMESYNRRSHLEGKTANDGSGFRRPPVPRYISSSH
ncbi:MAG TPA: hypothetical protein PKE65_06815 [Rhizobiaceae bacterium]|nr:hypothetical protein [Rhizobiaceae bacterium]